MRPSVSPRVLARVLVPVFVTAAPVFVVSAALLTASVGVVGCKSCGRHAGSSTAALGKVSDLHDLDVAPYLAAAHAVITHAAPPAAPPSRPGQRVFVTWWSPGHAAVRGTALGASLFDSVEAASEEVVKQSAVERGDDGAKGNAKPSPKASEGQSGLGADGRVELEVVVEAQTGSVESDASMNARLIGLYGYMSFDDNFNVGWVTPSELIDQKLVEAREDKATKLKSSELWYLLRQRAGVSNQAVKRMNRMRVRTEQWVESKDPGGAPVHLYRSMPVHKVEVTADDLLAAARAGADYIAGVCDDKGKFIYDYNPVNDESDKGYGLIRHAGAIYALMDAYSEFRVDAWKEAADRAFAFLEHDLKTSPNGTWIEQGDKEEQQKVGGAGLTLVAMSKYAEATGDKGRLPEMRELAKFIVHQQYPDGHFRANADVKEEDPTVDPKKLKKEVTYYPGEGILGLVRLYSIDPDPKWLDAAKKAADFIVNVRDAKTDEKHQIHDHWMSYALKDLYALTKDERYADHAFKIARAIISGEIREPKPNESDYVGAFFDKGPTTPSSTRLEALAADIQLSRVMGKDEAWLRGPATDIARFTTGQQLVGDALYFSENPQRARGGVRESLLSSDVRIDYPQHALSGWLRLGRELRDPTWGQGGLEGSAKPKDSGGGGPAQPH